jgi:hypothetical protein
MKDDTKIKRYQRLSLSRRQLLEVGGVGFGSLLLPGAFAAFGANAGNAATPNEADGPITSFDALEPQSVRRNRSEAGPAKASRGWAHGCQRVLEGIHHRDARTCRRRQDRTRRLSLISTRILDRQKRDPS